MSYQQATVAEEVVRPPGATGFWGVAETDTQNRPVRFYHLRDGERDMRNYRKPKFSRSKGPYLSPEYEGDEPRKPNRKDRIIFQTKGFYIAGLWTFLDEWEASKSSK